MRFWTSLGSSKSLPRKTAWCGKRGRLRSSERTAWRCPWSQGTGQLTQFRGSGTIQVKVRNENGTLLYDFPIEPDDSNYSLAKSIHDAAVQRNRQKERDLALSKMREELATR